MNEILFEYRGKKYPTYLRDGNAMQYILPIAKKFCVGEGMDIGGGKWPMPGAFLIDASHVDARFRDPCNLPLGDVDYIFSSHCLEHLGNPVAALEHWKEKLRPGGTLFLYLPHPEMEYWKPQFCRKHLHSWMPGQMSQLLGDLGFVDAMVGGRDLAWSFAAVAFKPVVSAVTEKGI